MDEQQVRRLNLSNAKKMISLSGLDTVGLEEVNLSGCTTGGINKLRGLHLKKLNIHNAPNANESWIKIVCDNMTVDELTMSSSLHDELDPVLRERLHKKTQVVLK